MARSYYSRRSRGNYNQNDGVPGVVYILRNEAFKENWVKIGQSRYSGYSRAQDLNKKASTGIPAHHVCIFECRTLDCGIAEKIIFKELQGYRKGRQEFFEIDLELAKSVITRVCKELDESINESRNVQAAAQKREEDAKRINDEFLKAAEEKRAEQDRKTTAEQLSKAQAILNAEAKRRERQQQEEMRRAQEEWQRQENTARRLQAEREQAKLPKYFDKTCPSCFAVLNVPIDYAGVLNQKFRCKNCATVFFLNGGIVSSDSPAVPNQDKPRHFEQSPGNVRDYGKAIRKWDRIAYIVVASFIAVFALAFYQGSQKGASPSPPKMVQAVKPPKTLKEAANEVSKKYPYLQTENGNSAVDQIIERRDQLITLGHEPAKALIQAADEIAPKLQPATTR